MQVRPKRAMGAGMIKRVLFLLLAVLLARPALARDPDPEREGVPRYQHVFVIILENKDYAQIMNPAAAPHIAGLAEAYGDATHFYGETHPSEGNYVALLGGTTHGIRDDDAWFCKPGMVRPECANAAAPDYPDHTLTTPHLGDQLAKAGFTWKAYLESLPRPGSLVWRAGDPKVVPGDRSAAVYASKHTGFTNFLSTQKDPQRARRLVGFDQLDRDLASGKLPNFALIIPNQCNEMHGLYGPGVPEDCDGHKDLAGLIKRGDAEVGRLVDRLMATKTWTSADNVAIVITFDEGSNRGAEGCCGSAPNHGGGHIPTVVVTNHGPHGMKDGTPYNHYALLRTIEDAFGIDEHLGHAGDNEAGVEAMSPLFRAP